MKRKVIKQGNNTLTITLPRKWTEQFNIKAGDEVELGDAQGMLCILTKKELAPKKISLNIDKLDKAVLDSLLAVLHKSGYDEIEIFFDEPKLVKAIQERINNMLIGYEIIDQTNKRCLIKSIASGYDSDIDSIVRRVFLVTLSLARNSLEAIKSGNLENIEELMVLEMTNNKLTNFCHRNLNKKPSEGPKTIYLYTIIWLLEKIADTYRDLCNCISERKIKVSKDTIKTYEKVVNLFEHFYHAFYKFDLEEMKKLRQEHREIIKDLHKLMESNQDKFVIHYMFNATQRIYDGFGSVTGMHF